MNDCIDTYYRYYLLLKKICQLKFNVFQLIKLIQTLKEYMLQSNIE